MRTEILPPLFCVFLHVCTTDIQMLGRLSLANERLILVLTQMISVCR